MKMPNALKTLTITSNRVEYLQDFKVDNYAYVVDFRINCANISPHIGHILLRIGGLCKLYYVHLSPHDDREKPQVYLEEVCKTRIVDDTKYALGVHVLTSGPFGVRMWEGADHGLIVNVLYARV